MEEIINNSVNSKVCNILFFIYLSMLSSRGLFEVLISKDIAYFIQICFCVIFYGYILLSGKFIKKKYFSIAVILYSGFIFLAIISGISTYIDKGFSSSWFYILINIFILFFIFLNVSFKISSINCINYKLIISVHIVLLIAVAVFQQITLSEVLPGTTPVFGDLIRPPSTTGSYLHYPLVLAILSMILLQLSVKPFKIQYFLISLGGIIGVITSFSRSGNMILFFSLLIFLCIKLFSTKMNKKHVIVYATVVLLLVSMLFFIISVFNENVFVERILSSVETDSSGNSERIDIWQMGIDIFMKSYFVMGTYTGLVTNATGNFELGSSFIVESGLLQQLINFGIFGVLCYYGLLILQIYSVNSRYYVLRACLIASILQTVVYQSIEVLPFMQLLALIPQISDYIDKK